MSENPEETARPEQPGSTAAGSRCPSCGARVGPDQQWCSLCLGPLSGAGAEQPGAGPEQPDARAGQPRPGVEQPTHPHVGAGGPPPPAGDDARSHAQAAADAMLAELAVGTAADRPLGRGPLRGLGRAGLLGVGCLAAFVLLGIGLGLLWLVGALL